MRQTFSSGEFVWIWPLDILGPPSLCTGEGAGAKEVADGLPLAESVQVPSLRVPLRLIQAGQCNTQTQEV